MELVVRKDNTMKLFGKKAQPKKEEPKMQEAVLTLYACRKDVKTVPDLACRLFSEVMDKILYTDEDEFHIQFKRMAPEFSFIWSPMQRKLKSSQRGWPVSFPGLPWRMRR